MTDTTDNNILAASIGHPGFQVRCRYRFVNAAIAVTTESSSAGSHVQRMAFAGAIFANTVDSQLLCELVLSNATNRTNCLANPQQPGGNILDADMDFQINSVFTGVATSRAW